MGSMADPTAPAEHPNPHAGEMLAGSHATMDDHGADHGHDDHNLGEGHGGEALGPFDMKLWGAAALGIVLGLAVVVALMQA
jgi:hypothetical protein